MYMDTIFRDEIFVYLHVSSVADSVAVSLCTHLITHPITHPITQHYYNTTTMFSRYYVTLGGENPGIATEK
jgi:hypothetical protein